MKKILINSLVSLALSLGAVFGAAEAIAEDNVSYNQSMTEPVDRVELRTSFIKGNKELPQVLYIVPWQEIKKVVLKPENMVLHSLYGDIFQPITPADLIE